MDNTYIPNDTYDRLTLALAAIEPCAITGKREPDQMVQALMAAWIWPASVQAENAKPLI
ncbi:hypothetical protein [Mesorhizobium sp.]|uniref:hypothetical protein n=1 Tax=Mesorhizobium sp. TaxID=1871066 RepID=UPI0025DAC9EE|nr:hypothetical protein [Mesorhizobium sp.]